MGFEDLVSSRIFPTLINKADVLSSSKAVHSMLFL